VNLGSPFHITDNPPYWQNEPQRAQLDNWFGSYWEIP
jgi:hypothetical protein